MAEANFGRPSERGSRYFCAAGCAEAATHPFEHPANGKNDWPVLVEYGYVLKESGGFGGSLTALETCSNSSLKAAVRIFNSARRQGISSPTEKHLSLFTYGLIRLQDKDLKCTNSAIVDTLASIRG
jgi:hypothetical protein